MSRPFQIVLLVAGLFAVVWIVALRGHSSSETGGGSSSASTPAPVTASTPASTAPKLGTPGAVYHGSAPGLEGLTRDIAKAHRAAQESEENAKRLERKSAQIASGTGEASTGAATPASQGTASATAPRTASRPAAARTGAHGRHASSASRVPAKQVLLEEQLEHGATVLILFWDPTGADDAFVREQAKAVQSSHTGSRHARVDLDVARASEVASFGSVTRAVQISSTPTILIVNRAGKTKALTGLWDSYSIQQAIAELPS